MKQEGHETVAAFVGRLRSKVALCDFSSTAVDTVVNGQVRDRSIAGLRSLDIRGELLKEAKFTLAGGLCLLWFSCNIHRVIYPISFLLRVIAGKSICYDLCGISLLLLEAHSSKMPHLLAIRTTRIRCRAVLFPFDVLATTIFAFHGITSAC